MNNYDISGQHSDPIHEERLTYSERYHSYKHLRYDPIGIVHYPMPIDLPYSIVETKLAPRHTLAMVHDYWSIGSDFVTIR